MSSFSSFIRFIKFSRSRFSSYECTTLTQLRDVKESMLIFFLFLIEGRDLRVVKGSYRRATLQRHNRNADQFVRYIHIQLYSVALQKSEHIRDTFLRSSVNGSAFSIVALQNRLSVGTLIPDKAVTLRGRIFCLSALRPKLFVGIKSGCDKLSARILFGIYMGSVVHVTESLRLRFNYTQRPISRANQREWCRAKRSCIKLSIL